MEGRERTKDLVEEVGESSRGVAAHKDMNM